MIPPFGEKSPAYSLPQLKADLSAVEQSWKEKPLWWKAGIPLLLFGLPALLIGIQYAVITTTIPVSVTVPHLLLNFSHPNATAMFASNYIHSVWLPEHIVENVAGYFTLLYAVFVLYCIVIPILRMHGLLSYEYPDAAFFRTALVLLFVLPFAVSGISVYFGRMLSQTGSWGFSGIVYGFCAYLFFLMVFIMYDLVLTRMIYRIRSPPETDESGTGEQPQDPPTPAGIALSLILITLVAALLPVFVILNEIGNGTIGVFGHLAGFAVGFIIAVIVMLISERKLVKNKAALAGFLLLVIAVPAGIWIIA